MKEIKQIEEYIGALENNPNPSPNTLNQISQAIFLMEVYKCGLLGKDFPLDKIHSTTLADIPEHFHTSVGQLAILKSDEGNKRTLEYIFKELSRTLHDFMNYFTTKPSPPSIQSLTTK